MARPSVPHISRATIRITDLMLRTVIGINDWERSKQQDIVINLALEFDPSEAVRSDRIEDTVDYKKVKRRVISLVERSKFGLVEKLAHAVLCEALKERTVLAATVRIDKPHALRFAQSVSVEMRAERDR